MPIFFGNHKIDKISVGNKSIGKIYKGGELLYQKTKGLKFYVATYNESTFKNYIYYDITGLLGSWSTSGYVVSCTYKRKYIPDGRIFTESKIYMTSGTLGTSGSKVGSSSSSHAAYRQTLNINGLTCYIYHGDAGIGDPIMFVLPDSVVNNYTINNSEFIQAPNADLIVHPSAVTNDSFTYETYSYGIQDGPYTVNKKTNDVLTFTKENGFI